MYFQPSSQQPPEQEDSTTTPTQEDNTPAEETSILQLLEKMRAIVIALGGKYWKYTVMFNLKKKTKVHILLVSR